MATSRASTSASPEKPCIIQAFEEQVKKYTLKTHQSVCGREYVRISKLVGWLRSKPHGSDISHFHDILDHVYTHDKNFGQVLDSTEEKRVDVVFCILLAIGRPNLVLKFQNAGIVDAKLPMDLGTLETTFRQQSIGDVPKLSESAQKKITDAFDHLQYKFRPHIFKHDDDKYLVSKVILGVLEKNALRIRSNSDASLAQHRTKRGGTSHVFEFTILEEFVHEGMRDILGERSRYRYTFKHKDEQEVDFCYRIAVKEYSADVKDERAAIIWSNEKEIFKMLQQCEEVNGVVQYLGCLRKRGLDEKTKMLILLELADYDLNDFFKGAQHITLPAEIREFWENIFGLADALVQLHERKITVEEKKYTSHALHADIKPENILSFGGDWRLADLGFAKLLRTEEMTEIYGYTRTWGAPECHPGRSVKDQVTPAIDIWSLGCVFSVAATWLLRGHRGVEIFDQVRIDATKRPKPKKTPSKQGPGTFFHNGVDCLEEVGKWHEYLKSLCYVHDHMTPQVLTLIDEHMLQGKRERRYTAMQLQDSLRDLVRQWKEPPVPGVEIDVRILATIDEYNKNQKHGQLMPESSESTSRRDAQSKDLLKNEKIRQDQANIFSSTVIGGSHLQAKIAEIQRETSIAQVSVQHGDMEVDKLLPNAQNVEHFKAELSTTKTATSTPSFRNERRQNKQQPKDPENVWQARAKLRKEKDRMRRLIAVPKDPKLKNNYKNRDIMFLLDNSWTMKDYWNESRDLLKVLLKKVRKYDDDGTDVLFTASGEILNSSNLEHLLHHIDTGKYDPKKENPINMAHRLQLIFDEFLNPKPPKQSRSIFHRRKEKKSKPTTLIILTDGVWPGCDKSDVKNTIKNHLITLKEKKGNLDDRPFTIQFVHFGFNVPAALYLDELDDDLCTGGLLDVIDTEPAREDIYKMLLGSLDPDYDKLDNGGPAIITEEPKEESGEDAKGEIMGDTAVNEPKTSLLNNVKRRVSNGAIRRPSPQRQLSGEIPIEAAKATLNSIVDSEQATTVYLDGEKAAKRLSNGNLVPSRRASSQRTIPNLPHQLTSITEQSSGDVAEQTSNARIDSMGSSPTSDTFTDLQRLPSITRTDMDQAVAGAERPSSR